MRRQARLNRSRKEIDDTQNTGSKTEMKWKIRCCGEQLFIRSGQMIRERIPRLARKYKT